MQEASLLRYELLQYDYSTLAAASLAAALELLGRPVDLGSQLLPALGAQHAGAGAPEVSACARALLLLAAAQQKGACQ